MAQKLNSNSNRFFRNAYLTAGVYLIFAVYFSCAYRADDYASRGQSNIVLIPGLVAIFCFYVSGYKLLRRASTTDIKTLILAATLTALAAFFIPPFYSSDLYSYVNGGWQQARYNINPYTLMVVATPGFGKDPMLSSFWSLNPFPYGFLFAAIAKNVCLLSQGRLQIALILFKLLNFGAYFLTAILVYKGAIAFGQKRPDLSLYLFLFSPIILIHTVSNGHNDILMTLAVMAAFYCLKTSRHLYVVPLLVASVSLKLLWTFSLPPTIIFMAKKMGLKLTAFSVALGCVFFGAISYPYLKDWRDFQWVELHKNLSVNVNSLAATIEHLRSSIVKLVFLQQEPIWLNGLLSNIATISKILLSSIFFCAWLCLLYRLLKKNCDSNLQSMLCGFVWLALFAVCFVSGKFYPWYIAMFFPVALWLPERLLARKIAIALSCSQVFAITAIGHDHINNFVLLTLIPCAIFIGLNIDRRNLFADFR